MTLEQCPFCASRNVSLHKKNVACDDCGTCGPFNEDDPEGAWNHRALAAIPQWQPIDTAPVGPYDKDHPFSNVFRCLLQTYSGGVYEGAAYYALPNNRTDTPPLVIWRNSHGQCSPKYWMPLPAPKVEA